MSVRTLLLVLLLLRLGRELQLRNAELLGVVGRLCGEEVFFFFFVSDFTVWSDVRLHAEPLSIFARADGVKKYLGRKGRRITQ